MPQRKPTLPYGRQWIDEDDVAAVAKACSADLVTQGPQLAAFERALAARCNAPYAVATSSGSAALHLAAAAVGLGVGDVAITSPLTFVATASAAVHCGATPHFVDIDPATRNLSPEALERALATTESTPRAIFPVHYAGLPAEPVRIAALARAHGAVVIEDASHALGARYRDEHGVWHEVGSCAHADLTCFSFQAVKHVTTGEGGAVTTRCEALYRRLLSLRNHGIARDPSTFVESDEHLVGPWYYEVQGLGWNYRITEMQCALGLSQLRRLEAFVERRRAIAARYHQAFADLRGVTLPIEPGHLRHAWHLYPLWLDEERLGRGRREVFEAMRARGLGVQVHYIPVHLHPYYRRRFGTRPGEFPEAERYYRGAISIPLYPRLADDEVEHVVSVVRDVLCGD